MNVNHYKKILKAVLFNKIMTITFVSCYKEIDLVNHDMN